MRKLMFAAAAAAICTPAISSAAAADYFLKIEGVARSGAAGPIYLDVSTGDLDGDGAADRGVLRIHCDGGTLRSAHFVISPRDAQSGMPTGRRMAAPGVPVADWLPPGGLARHAVGWDLKSIKGARVSNSGGWTAAQLSGAEDLCPAATAIINTSRSNIKY